MTATLTAPQRVFRSFGKIPRLDNLTMTVSEKIDGTNAAVVITEDGDIYAQSRKRVITPEDDNFGFAAWVDKYRVDLLRLGPGVHFGEWWGLGIQRGYGQTEKRFSLFNTHRWSDEKGNRPWCCDVVPTLYIGPFDRDVIESCLIGLHLNGSRAAPGFDRPEGVMVYIHELDEYVKHPFAPKAKGGS